MKIKNLLLGIAAIGLLFSCSPQNKKEESTVKPFEQSTATYAAEVPDYLITPNSVQTKYAGELKFIDGFPTDETLEKANYFMDVARAFELFESGTATASMYAMLNGHREIGVIPNKTVALTEQLMDAK